MDIPWSIWNIYSGTKIVISGPIVCKLRKETNLEDEFSRVFFIIFFAQPVYYLEDSRHAWVLLGLNIGSYETVFGDPPFNFFLSQTNIWRKVY